MHPHLPPLSMPLPRPPCAGPILRSTSAAPIRVGGLRALWRGLLKSNAELSDLRPIIMIKESHTGLGMQLRLAAGPLKDAAAAAKICAALTESERACETTVFDGQRLTMNADEAQGSAQGSAQTGQPAIKPMPAGKGGYYRRDTSHHSKQDNAPAPAKPESSTFSYAV